ncbi:unnamed protein product [Phytophthora lilii]|uniref:Unnamed protein product n=1 Tax=Phytophthora lilii TaxID=2077276 RepID=A0A9W6Y1D5_9STRA|nr:unnamed protein product [Phytophthora lilii]
MKVCIFLFAVQTLWQVFQIGSDLWLSHWTGEKGGSYNQDETAYNVKVYSLLGAGAAVMVFVRSATVAIVGLRASRHLFDNMTLSLLKAPLRFFDANPIGRIVNRYGDDMSAVDFMIPFAFGGFLAMFFFTVCQLATAVYTMNFLGALIIPLVWMYVKIANFYLAPSREISRLWKVSSSPVLSHVTQSEEGVVIIRAFGAGTVDRMVTENFIRNDVNSKCWFSETVTQQWFQVRMQLIGSGVIFVVVSGLVYLRDYLSPGMVGLAFTTGPFRPKEVGDRLSLSRMPRGLDPPPSSSKTSSSATRKGAHPCSKDCPSTSATTRRSASSDAPAQASRA